MCAPILTGLRRSTALLLVYSLLVTTWLVESGSNAAAQQAGEQSSDLHQLVAPIALYPDALVAQVLAAATYPDQIVDADRWLQQNSNLKGEELSKAVDKQPWDVSVKALTEFPSVLDNMSKNLSWTSAMGDAFFNEPQQVMDAVQQLRKQAKDAGNLKTTKEQTVTTEGQTIIIQPSSPEVVYVPTYSPAVVYGAPVPAYPGYSGWDVAAASMISFGVGMAVGAAVSGGCCGWGWNSWGAGWHGGTVVYNRNTYISNSNTFVNRNSAYRNGNYANRNANVNRGNGNLSGNNVNRSGNTNTVNRGGNTVNRGGNTININTPGNQSGQQAANRGQNNPGQTNRGQGSQAQANANRGYGQSRDSGTRSNGFSGYTAGGNARAQTSRGQSSFSGGARGGGARSGGGGGGRRR